jgi:hypothetical protein
LVKIFNGNKIGLVKFFNGKKKMGIVDEKLIISLVIGMN